MGDVRLEHEARCRRLLASVQVSIPQERNLSDLGREVDQREGDAEDLAFEDSSFDTVVCT
jgi:2-polyprenyl-3-methyl-5-hydroxy-6-metoxy-1,4-benzoquinol methylase